jgi:signal transduction histidine kinase
MVIVNASRTAGMRLSGIILTLIVPIILLGGILANTLRHEIALTQKEILGLQLVDIVTPILIEKASGKPGERTAEQRLKLAVGLAEKIGISEEYSELIGLFESKLTRPDKLVEETAHLLHAVGSNSNLILDPVAESFFLALTNIMNLPDLVSHLHAFQFELDGAIATRGIDSAELKRILLMLGELSAAIERSSDSINHAREESADPGRYENALAVIRGIEKEISVTRDVMSTVHPGAETLTLTMLSKQTIDPSGKYLMAGEVWKQTSNRLRDILTTRKADMWLELLTIVGLGMLAMLLAGAAAVWLFRSTLRRLDLVEVEIQRADDARGEAEAMHDKIAVINNDISALNKELANKVLHLKEAQEELVQKGRLEQLGHLTATIAHEIRNPLGSVRTSAFLLDRKLRGKGLDVEAQLIRINRGVTRCDNIINQLLDYSRTKQPAFRPEILDEWLARIVAEEAARLPVAVSIKCSLGLGDRQIPFDPSRLQRVIVNLLDNASEALVGAGDDPGKFSSQRPCIEIETKVIGSNATISVTDNGPGISPSNLAKVRQPLFTTKSFGTGLGVPAIEKILEQHGGSLEISSVEGRGATFCAYLPLQPPVRANEAA